MQAAARITATNAPPAEIEFGIATGKTKNEPEPATRAANKPPRFCGAERKPIYGSKITANRGTSVSSAMRASPETDPSARSISTAGSANSPSPITIASLIKRHRGHSAPRSMAINPADKASNASVKTCLSRCGNRFGCRSGSRSTLSAEPVHSKLSSSKAAIGAARAVPFLPTPRGIMFPMKTQRAFLRLSLSPGLAASSALAILEGLLQKRSKPAYRSISARAIPPAIVRFN